MTHPVSKMLDYQTVTAERETGFWIGVLVATGKAMARDDWLNLMEDDPERFQLVTLTAEEQTRYS